jgi:hypothetical protein
VNDPTILAAFERIRSAMLANDADALRAAVAADYLGSDAGGRAHDREGMLAAYGPGGVRLELFEVPALEIRSWADTALLLGDARIRGSWGDQTFAHDLRFLDVYVRRDGAWLLIASHVAERAAG